MPVCSHSALRLPGRASGEDDAQHIILPHTCVRFLTATTPDNGFVIIHENRSRLLQTDVSFYGSQCKLKGAYDVDKILVDEKEPWKRIIDNLPQFFLFEVVIIGTKDCPYFCRRKIEFNELMAVMDQNANSVSFFYPCVKQEIGEPIHASV